MSAQRLTKNEVDGYNRAWLRRMTPRMRLSIRALRERRTELLREAAMIQVAILTMERVKKLRV